MKKIITYKIKKTLNVLFHPFKYGFWTILNIRNWKLGMLWENYDSYAGDCDYGFIQAWTGNRKTTKEMKSYDCFVFDEDGFVFTVPFFISYIILIIPTIIDNIKSTREMNKQIKFFNTHSFNEETNSWELSNIPN